MIYFKNDLGYPPYERYATLGSAIKVCERARKKHMFRRRRKNNKLVTRYRVPRIYTKTQFVEYNASSCFSRV